MAHKFTPEIISAAISGFEQQKQRIDAQIADLQAMLSGGPARAAALPEEAPKGKRRKMSAAARKRIGDAQRKRWAASKGESEDSQTTSEAPKPKRKLSRAGRAAIVAATKRRWALKRAEGAKATPKKIARKEVAAKTELRRDVQHAQSSSLV
jgi:hypothetical protein